MALISCPECQAMISDRAVWCPRCGVPANAVAPQPSGLAVAPWTQGSEPVSPPRETLAVDSALYTPPPLQIRPAGMLLGLLLLGLGIYSLLYFVPDHDPVDRITASLGASIANLDRWYFSAGFVPVAKTFCWLIMGLGAVQLLTGSATRSGRLVYCGKCDAQVLGRKAFWHWRCERCGGPVMG